MTLSDQQAFDYTLTALCIWREARGESLDAKRWVAWTIRNRVTHPSWWGVDWSSVILAPYQFSSFNKNDPNATQWPLKHEKVWLECVTAATEVWEALKPDPTNGATHYHDESVNPAWAKKMVKTGQMGKFTFYKET